MASLRLLTLLVLATLLSAMAAAQNERPWMHFFQEAMASDGDDDGIDEEAYETLCDLEANPMNINTATYADLCRLPFLSERNIDDIRLPRPPRLPDDEGRAAGHTLARPRPDAPVGMLHRRRATAAKEGVALTA